MILKVFSVRDIKSGIFHPPFFKSTHGVAERDFRTMVTDDKTTIAKNPEDFDLFYLGEYDDQIGKFECLDTPQHMLSAAQCLNPQ